MEINVALASTPKQLEMAKNAVAKQEKKILKLLDNLEDEKVKLGFLKAKVKYIEKAAKDEAAGGA